MKTIGLLGGMSWESTALYYRYINEGVRERLGGLHSARIAMVSVDFEQIERLQHQDDWKGTADILCDAARRIELAGADLLLICTNTMHRVAPEIEAAIDIPLLHLADATAAAIRRRDIATVGLLGTRFTMEQAFYRERLEQQGLRVLTPSGAERELIHRTIYEELCLGRIEAQSRTEFLRIIDTLQTAGAEGIVLGCTEIAMLVEQCHTGVPLFDTTRIHAEAAVERALA